MAARPYRPGLTPVTQSPRSIEDEKVMARLDSLASLMDSRFVIPGTGIRFGLDALLDLIPGIGDFAGTAVSAYLIWEARRLRVPAGVILRMVGNVIIDFVLGAFPILGTVADVFWRANNRNVALLRDHLAARRR